jgi:hypothetical protein
VLASCGGDDDSTDSTAATPTENDGAPNNCATPSEIVPEADVTKQYPAAPEMTIDPAKQYVAAVKTVRGDFSIRLRPDLAPSNPSCSSRRTGTSRCDVPSVLTGFMPAATPLVPVPVARATRPASSPPRLIRTGHCWHGSHERSNSAGSQWFVNYAATPIDGLYTILARVTEPDVMDCITPATRAAIPARLRRPDHHGQITES